MGKAFFIVWRESLEAMLVVGVLYSCLSRDDRLKKALRMMWAGVGLGILASVVPSGVNPVWNTTTVLDGGSGVGKFLASFVGYQSHPSLTIVLTYLAYGLGAGFWIRWNRMSVEEN